MKTLMLALLTTSAVATLLPVDAAHAQTTGPAADPASDAQADNPNDIVVTAQKRQQTLIDIPQAVSVVSGAALERNQAFNFQDYAKLIPGLNVSQSNPGEGRLVLRGVNTGGVAATVSTYVDETPFGSSSGLVNAAILAGEFDTFDIARIEVLKGPQGTLYGASSLGGVVKFVTTAPQTGHIEARARGSIETVKGGDLSYLGSAMLNLPLGDKLAIRGSGFYRDYAGFIDSIGTRGSDTAKDINSSRSYGGRVAAQFTPTSDISVRLTAILQNLKTDVGNLVESDPVTLNTLYGGLTQSRYYPQSTDIRYRLYNGTISIGLGIADLVSSTSYSTLKQRNKDDFTVQYGALLGLYTDATGPVADIGFDTQTNLERWTQEVRLSSNGAGVFDWLIGGYYSHEKGALLQVLKAYNQGTLTPSPAVPLLADIFLRL
jgi:outer membrane receptor protein involved in Fe transport